MDSGALPGQTFTPPPSIRSGESLTSAAAPQTQPATANASAVEHMKVMQLVMAFQVRLLPSRYSPFIARRHPPCIYTLTSTSAHQIGPAHANRFPAVHTFLPSGRWHKVGLVQNLTPPSLSIQTRGHNICDLDPLGMYEADLDNTTPPDLEVANYG
jgi:hypothetical protein